MRVEPPTDTPLLLTVDDVARLLNLPPESVKSLHRFKELRGVVVCRKLRWRRVDVEKYVASLNGGAR